LTKDLICIKISTIMTGETEGSVARESLRKLPDSITRQLLIVKGRSGLQLQNFDNFLVRNQAQFGRGTDDYVSMVKIHQNSGELIDAKVLGVREEVRKRRMVIEDGVETEFAEAKPRIRNIWVGEYAKLITPDEAAKTEYDGQTALKWATINGILPEMVAKASNGYFYPATKNDVVMSPKKN
jgi:ribosomal protein L19